MNWPNFKFEEFACKHCGRNLMKEDFINKLQFLRTELGYPLIVSSGYRCPEYNIIVATTGPEGPHTTGRAVDLLIRGVEALDCIEVALVHGFTGLGVSQKGDQRFLHLDDLTAAQGFPRPNVWSY